MEERAYIAINYNCNHNCLFCPHINNPRRRAGEMSFEEFKKSFDFILNTRPQTKYVTVSGGEPTLNKDFIKIMNYISSKNIKIGLFSNSDKFSDLSLAQELAKKVNLKELQVISVIHSHKPEINDKITQVPGSFVRSTNGLKNLISVGINVRIKNCINKLNCSDLVDYFSFIYKEFPHAGGLEFCGLDYCGITKEQSDKVKVGFAEMGHCLNSMFDFIKKENINFHTIVREIPMCIVKKEYRGYFSCDQIKNGSYCSPDIGSGKEEKVVFDTAKQSGTFSKKCRDCVVNTRCSGSWKTAWELLGDQEIRPITNLPPSKYTYIEGETVFLRFLQEEDISTIYNWDCDLTVRHFWHDNAEIEPLFCYKENILRNWRNKYHQIFIISKKRFNNPVGFIYSSKYNRENGHLDVSIYIIPEFRRGVTASEAGIVFCDHLFKNYPLRKIYLTCYSNNTESLSFARSAGFVEEGRLRKHKYFDGKYYDKITLGIFKEDFYLKLEKVMTYLHSQ